MDQRIQTRLRDFPGAVVPAGIVIAAAAGSATAHVVAAATVPAGAMSWWMAAMGVACLACAAPLLRWFCTGLASGRLAAVVGGQPAAGAARRSAGHLLAMSALMILIHLVLVLGSGAGAHHGTAEASGPVAQHGRFPGQYVSHGGVMLALVAVEMLCLMGASAVLRLARHKPPASYCAAAPAAVGQ